MLKKSKIKFQLPDTFVLILFIVIIAVAMTWFIPAGEYDKIKDAAGKTVVVPDGFHFVEQSPVSLLKIPDYIVQGLSKQSGIIFFVLIVSGTFSVIVASGTFNNLTMSIAKKMEGKEKYIIPIFMTLFSLLCTTQGINTLIGFTPVAVMLARSVGYDAMVGVALIILGGGIGFSCGTLNPQTTGIAQTIAGLPLYSGIGYRFFCQVALLVPSCIYTMRYAEKVKRDKKNSLTYNLEIMDSKNSVVIDGDAKLSIRQILILLVVMVAYVLLIYGSVNFAWGIKEQSSIFIWVLMIAGVLSGLGSERVMKEFINGAKNVVMPILLLGLAASISLVMQDGKIMDSCVYYIVKMLSYLPAPLQGVGMYTAQTLAGFVIVAGSGLAVVTMPIMIPVADILHISRQTAVLAFNFGDGFLNHILPYGGAILGVMGVVGVDFNDWFKFAAKIVIGWQLIGCVLIVISQLINYGPF